MAAVIQDEYLLTGRQCPQAAVDALFAIVCDDDNCYMLWHHVRDFSPADHKSNAYCRGTMAANIKKYLDNPAQALGNKARKIYLGWTYKIRLAAEKLAGNYTEQTIDLDWEGKPSRIDLINQLIETGGYKKYLEIGCRDDACFSVIKADYKVGVDPNSGGTLRMTSDAFFAQNKETFDIIFIDGLHTYEQVLKDILNAAKVLNPGGTILMHDCLPLCCLAQFQYPMVKAWNGDVWKSFVQARTMPDLDAATCMIDHGVGIIRVRKNSRPLDVGTTDFKKLKYKDLAENYKEWMNAIEFGDVGRFINS